MTGAGRSLRSDLDAILRAGIDAASAATAVSRALSNPDVRNVLGHRPLHVLAAGKAAGSMLTALVGAGVPVTRALGSGTHQPAALPATVEWHTGSHPFPDERSVAAGRRALDLARQVGEDDTLLVLLSGGASALMALPADGLTLADKRRTVEVMMHAGADIHALNAVRKHLSAIKGGRLAAASRGTTITLAVSDVIGDDLGVIGSGPGVGDRSTWREVAALLDRYGGAEHPEAVRALAARGAAGDQPETPRPGDAQLARASAYVIARNADALAGARAAAAARGYTTVVFDDPISGEARVAARIWLDRALVAAATAARPVCVLSGGETTVRVTGRGRGGRNQEFALAIADRLAAQPHEILVASAGTDGIDGPTDAAGAWSTRTTAARAAAAGRSVAASLDDNDAYGFFSALGDLIRLGRTDTNVGDLQICLII